MTSAAHSRHLQHEQSLPVFNSLSLPLDLALVPASTRTSYTRVDMSRPVTSAGPAIPAESDSDGADSASNRPHTTVETSTGRFVRNRDEEADTHMDHGEETKELSEENAGNVPRTPQASVTFLLVNGKRRTMQFDPETTVGRVKELVWNNWPNGMFINAFIILGRSILLSVTGLGFSIHGVTFSPRTTCSLLLPLVLPGKKLLIHS